jgi:hypothetical protein
MKNDGTFQTRSLSGSGPLQAVPRYQDVVGSLDPQHLDPNQHRCNDDGMHPIDAHRVHALKPRQPASLLICEAAVGAQVCYGSARFNPAENVPLGQMLVLN